MGRVVASGADAAMDPTGSGYVTATDLDRLVRVAAARDLVV